MSQSNALVEPTPKNPLVLNALASVQSSTDNPKYARHFIGRYADRANATLANGDIDETEYLTLRAGGDDDYAEMFEETIVDL